MVDSPVQNEPYFSSAKPSSATWGASTAVSISDGFRCLHKTLQPPGSRWKSLLAEMLNEADPAKRELAALALEQAILERHRELTKQRSCDAESMLERLKMKDAFMRLLDVKSQLCFRDRDHLSLESSDSPAEES